MQVSAFEWVNTFDPMGPGNLFNAIPFTDPAHIGLTRFCKVQEEVCEAL